MTAVSFTSLAITITTTIFYLIVSILNLWRLIKHTKNSNNRKQLNSVQALFLCQLGFTAVQTLKHAIQDIVAFSDTLDLITPAIIRDGLFIVVMTFMSSGVVVILNIW